MQNDFPQRNTTVASRVKCDTVTSMSRQLHNVTERRKRNIYIYVAMRSVLSGEDFDLRKLSISMLSCRETEERKSDRESSKIYIFRFHTSTSCASSPIKCEQGRKNTQYCLLCFQSCFSFRRVRALDKNVS